MAELVERAGLADEIAVESAGTSDWHVGRAPDARATAAAAARGYRMRSVARQVTSEDFARFDLVVAMDRDNARDLRDLAGDERAAAKVRLLREFDPASVDAGELEVPDPYYGDEDGFEHVLDLVEAACGGLLATLRGAAPAPA